MLQQANPKTLGDLSTMEDLEMESESELDIADIMELIPHRYPFLMIDRIEQICLGESAVGIKNVSINEWYFQGHFPDRPILPGVLIVEAMAQTAAALVMKTLQLNKGFNPKEKLVYFMSLEGAKFRKPVFPGDVLELKVLKERQRGAVWRFNGEARVRGELMDEAVFSAMIAGR